MANYIVIRPAPGLPDGFMPPDLDGKWIDLDTVPVRFPRNPEGVTVTENVPVPTGRFEVRDHDGAVAEVYEVRQ
jgi:hypothetical protein